MAKPVSVAQKNFFDNLLNDKQFPENTNKDQLREQFSQLTTANASQWIEKAMALPDANVAGETTVNAPF